MALRDLIPGTRGRDVDVRRPGEPNPLLNFHREMNRLFDDVFRGFELAPLGGGRTPGWPHIEVSETDKEMTVAAELPGLDEKDVQVEIVRGTLVLRGEKKTETEDKERLFSERLYGRFERRIPLDGVDEEKVTAAFKNGVLTVTLPKTVQAQAQVRRIAIDGR